MKCYRKGGCGPYEMHSCADCPASKPGYAARGKKVLTNADHIRSMTDEELINVVTCPMGFSMFRCTVPMPCGDCKREWLKQPYKEAQ